MQSYCGFFRRFIASIIDIFVVILLFVFIGFITETQDETFCIIFVLTLWIYFAYQESSTLKGTVGKQALNLIVTDINGNQISFKQATKRFIMKILTTIPLFMGFLLIFMTSKKQAFHDLFAKTVVYLHED
jgi:uncharacterized RDD family membrane protein YckC